MLNMTKTFLALMLLGAFHTSFAIDGESIVFNPTTGNYLINHYSPIDKKFEQLVFIPATKINPMFQSKFKLEQGIVQYGYTLTSGLDSKQMISGFLLDPVSSVTTSLPDIPLNAPPGKIMDDMDDVANYFKSPPKPWHAMMGYSRGQMSFRISWSYNLETGGLTPGSRIASGFKSRDLPGIIQAEIYGDAPGSQEIDGEELPDAEDGGFGQQYFALVNNDFLHRPAAVPAIAVPIQFDAAVLLDRIQTQMHTWIAMQLLDATFSAQLDRYFQSAADAYRLNQPKVGKKQIQTMRALIKKEQPDADKEEDRDEKNKKGGKDDDDNKTKRVLIDKLAARVLDFDLKYVMMRMGGDKDD